MINIVINLSLTIKRLMKIQTPMNHLNSCEMTNNASKKEQEQEHYSVYFCLDQKHKKHYKK